MYAIITTGVNCPQDIRTLKQGPDSFQGRNVKFTVNDSFFESKPLWLWCDSPLICTTVTELGSSQLDSDPCLTSSEAHFFFDVWWTDYSPIFPLHAWAYIYLLVNKRKYIIAFILLSILCSTMTELHNEHFTTKSCRISMAAPPPQPFQNGDQYWSVAYNLANSLICAVTGAE